jgi:cytochrome c553
MTLRRAVSAMVIVSALLAAAFVTGFAQHQPSAPAAPAVSARTLELSITCQSCHGRDGISVSNNIPNLAGQKAGYLGNQLRAFKSGERKNDLMAAIAGQLSTDDITGLAAYWSARPAIGESAVAGHSGVAALMPKNHLPADFPRGFSIYDTEENEANKTITRHYANVIAIAAVRTNTPMPDGSMIVVENLAARVDAAGNVMKNAQGGLIAGNVTSYATSQSAAGWGADVPELLRNGNWSFSQHNAQGTITTANQASCLACHKPHASDDFMFTRSKLETFAKGGQD